MTRLAIHTTSSFRESFERFAEQECKGNSPLYYHLSKQIACDEDLLDLCTFVRDGQPVPNAFLAAVHFMVLNNKHAPLATYYPSVSKQTVQEIPFALFKAFTLQHQSEVIHLLQHRIVQTNVITRCNYLLPVFANILAESPKPATIIDIGASAGLNLNFDRYEYYYNQERLFGRSNVKLHCEVRDGNMPSIPPFNVHLNKIGIDQHLIDPANADDLTWLHALVWPDQTERFLMMKEALREPALREIRRIQGSSIEDFRNVMEAVDPAETLIIYATHVLYQFPDELLHAFYRLLDTIGRQRDCYFLSAEATKAVQLKYHTQNTAVVLTTYKNKRKEETLIAETNGHGNWIKWRQSEDVAWR